MLRHVHIALLTALLSACGDGAAPAPNPSPTGMRVNAASGASFDLSNTTWTRCEADWPAAGQSYWHAWGFGEGTAIIRHEVYTASTGCSGATDPAEHFEVAMNLDVDGGNRLVGWEGGFGPDGCPASLTATGVTFTAPAYSLTAGGVAWVDDTRTPPRIFVSNPGDTPVPPLDADGYPTVMTTLDHELR